jgi:phytoene/squalene synthetase
VTLNLAAADAYCRLLTRRHYENFSVASRFVDAHKRLDLARIYAFCRTTDDLGDESLNGNALPRCSSRCKKRSRGARCRHSRS